jgi:hypothetical protein
LNTIGKTAPHLTFGLATSRAEAKADLMIKGQISQLFQQISTQAPEAKVVGPFDQKTG